MVLYVKFFSGLIVVLFFVLRGDDYLFQMTFFNLIEFKKIFFQEELEKKFRKIEMEIYGIL